MCTSITMHEWTDKAFELLDFFKSGFLTHPNLTLVVQDSHAMHSLNTHLYGVETKLSIVYFFDETAGNLSLTI